MEFIQLIVALLALNLFLLFLAQPFLLAWRLLVARANDVRDDQPLYEHPDDVDAEPIVDMEGLHHYSRLGRDRWGRMVYKSYEGGGVRYYYLDREASERKRLGTKRPSSAAQGDERGPRMAIGWKGFTADSSPWEVLGVARDASINQIKAAYRKLIPKYHPDRFSNLTKAEIDQLERDSKLINAAYSKLVKS